MRKHFSINYSAGWLAALAGMALGAPIAQAAPQTPAPPRPANAKPEHPAPQGEGVFIGELSIQHIRKSHGLVDITFEGPGVTVETRDTKRNTHLLVIADQIVGHRRAKDHSSADFIGNVRYTLTEKMSAGSERVVQGTAGRAVYAEADKTLRLSANVNATLTDPTRFDGPATLRVGSLLLSNEGHYRMAGNASSNDARFTPVSAPSQAADGTKSAVANDKNGKRKTATMQVGAVHVSGFASGSMDTGQSARFDGPQVTIETVNTEAKTRNTLTAPHIAADLESGKHQVEAAGGMHYDLRRTIQRKTAKGMNVEVAQAVVGTAAQAVWKEAVRANDKVVAPPQIDLTGSVNATLTDASALKEPATLAAEHVMAVLGDTPRYVITGSPERTRLAFAPRPAPAGAKPKQAGQAPAVKTAVGAPDAGGNAVVQPVTAANSDPPADKDVQDAQEASGGVQGQDNQANAPRTPPFLIGNIVVTAFQTATYEPNKSLIVDGPTVRFVSKDAASKNYAEMQTPHLEADFDEDSALTAARATKNVLYKFQQPLKKPGTMQTIEGTGRAATFTNAGETSQVVKVEGVGEFNITNPELFEDVAHGKGNKTDDTMTFDLVTHDFALDSPQKTIGFRYVPVAGSATDLTAGGTTPKKPAKKKRK